MTNKDEAIMKAAAEIVRLRRDIPSDYDFLDVERVEYTGPDRFVEIAGERIDLNDVPDTFAQTCPCGRPSASPPEEIYCVECATGGRRG